MNNVFKINTVDSIVSNLMKTVTNLEKARDKHTLLADVANADMEEALARRDANLDEATRAEKIAANVKKLLDIS